VIAIYYVCRHLDIGLRDLVRAIFKSGIVTVLSSLGAAACALLVEHKVLGPVFGLGLAGTSTAICWLLSISVTEHPLLARLQSAAGGLFRVPTIKISGHSNPTRSARDGAI
jgi:hypothetical protein